MPELLIEVGCEELPASFVRAAYESLRDLLLRSLEEEGLAVGVAAAMGTPRRLIVQIGDVPAKQDDRTVEQRGPALKAAYDATGAPTKALEGFCRSQGVSVDDLRRDEQYVWVTKTIPGLATAELLSTLIPKAIRAIPFEKSMRWGSSKIRFARPIRWLLASFDGKAVEFEIEGVAAGLSSRGHRFYKPESFGAATFDRLLAGLRERFVEPDPDERRRKILHDAAAVAGVEPAHTEALVDENVFLTEWPSAVLGTFDERFLELPDSVLVTAMAKHERFFPVREGARLANRFVSIRNAGEDDSVRAGNEWVLNARFNDAKFFFDEDKRHTLAEFLEKTSGILFQDKLGTVRQRADRLSKLAGDVARSTGGSAEEVTLAERAGMLAKADLSTGLVGELASLQGTIGGEYAKREGEPQAVCEGIAAHYDLAKCFALDGIARSTAVRLFLADNLDKLAGFLGIGLEPSGSSDPFGLRRAASALIEAAWQWPAPMASFVELLERASAGYRDQGVHIEPVAAKVAGLFAARYEALLPDERHDLLEAAMLTSDVAEALRPQGVACRLKTLERLVQDPSFVHTATRPANIVSAARKKGIMVTDALPSSEALQGAEGAQLLEAIASHGDEARTAAIANDDERLAKALLPLSAPVNTFFDSTMVMVDDQAVRDARLALLHGVDRLFRLAGDFTKVVIEG